MTSAQRDANRAWAHAEEMWMALKGNVNAGSSQEEVTSAWRELKEALDYVRLNTQSVMPSKRRRRSS